MVYTIDMMNAEHFTWSGKHGKGAMRKRRELKRVEAAARNEQTPFIRRAAYRKNAA